MGDKCNGGHRMHTRRIVELDEGTIEPGGYAITDSLENGTKKVELHSAIVGAVDDALEDWEPGDGFVTTAKIADGAVEMGKLSEDVQKAIEQGGGGDIPEGAITTDKLADYAVTSIKMLDGQVTTEKIEDEAVTGKKIAPGTIKSENIGSGVIRGSNIAEETITINNLADGAVRTRVIYDNQITERKIAPGAITRNVIASNTITSTEMTEGAVTTSRIEDGAVTTEKIYDGSVTTDKLESGIADTIGGSFVSQIATSASGAGPITYRNVTQNYVDDVAKGTKPISVRVKAPIVSGTGSPVPDGSIYIRFCGRDVLPLEPEFHDKALDENGELVDREGWVVSRAFQIPQDDDYGNDGSNDMFLGVYADGESKEQDALYRVYPLGLESASRALTGSKVYSSKITPTDGQGAGYGQNFCYTTRGVDSDLTANVLARLSYPSDWDVWAVRTPGFPTETRMPNGHHESVMRISLKGPDDMGGCKLRRTSDGSVYDEVSVDMGGSVRLTQRVADNGTALEEPVIHELWPVDDMPVLQESEINYTAYYANEGSSDEHILGNALVDFEYVRDPYSAVMNMLRNVVGYRVEDDPSNSGNYYYDGDVAIVNGTMYSDVTGTRGGEIGNLRYARRTTLVEQIDTAKNDASNALTTAQSAKTAINGRVTSLSNTLFTVEFTPYASRDYEAGELLLRSANNDFTLYETTQAIARDSSITNKIKRVVFFDWLKSRLG